VPQIKTSQKGLYIFPNLQEFLMRLGMWNVLALSLYFCLKQERYGYQARGDLLNAWHQFLVCAANIIKLGVYASIRPGATSVSACLKK
jgi:hypothetical protein